MRISLTWLKEFIDTASFTPTEIADKLTDIGLEVESVTTTEAVPGGLAGVVVAEVLSTIPHPNADKLRICQVGTGQGEPLSIVCGAPNVAQGQKVALATIGATLYPTQGEPFKIKKSKIRGEESFGMLCAKDELGIGEDHEGILVLPSDAQVGTPLAQALGLEGEVVFEIGLTPNRTDAMCHFGVARDLAAALRKQVCLQNPPEIASAFPCPLSLTIADVERCPRYAGVVVRGVNVGPSPTWLQERLIAIGAKPINNIVDVTNYVLFELGHPLHAFDLRAFESGSVVIKTVDAGKKFTALDSAEYTLSESDLCITDGQQPLCLAGVMGGLHSGTTLETTDIFLECASFQPDTVRKTSKAHQLFSESAYRFARGTDPEWVPFVLKRAVQLILQVAGGTCSEPIDSYPQPEEAVSVTFHYEQLNRIAGAELPREEVEEILELLGFRFIQKNRQYAVLQVPGYRRDVFRFQDVAEEVLRIYGLNNIPLPEKLNAAPILTTPTASIHTLQQRVADGLAALGFNEIRTNSLGSADRVGEGALRTLNPLSQDVSVLRTSLLPAALEVVAHNLNRQQAQLRLFEFGRTYHNLNGKPTEESALLMLQVGMEQVPHWAGKPVQSSIFSLGRSWLQVQEWLGVQLQATELEPDDTFAFGLCYKLGKHTWARLGCVQPALAQSFDIQEPVYAAVISWHLAAKHWLNAKTTFQELPKFPVVRRDLSMHVAPGITFQTIAQIVKQCDPKRIQAVELFDVYFPKDGGQTSYAISIQVQDSQQTLAESALTSLLERAMNALQETGKVTIRKGN